MCKGRERETKRIRKKEYKRKKKERGNKKKKKKKTYKENIPNQSASRSTKSCRDSPSESMSLQFSSLPVYDVSLRVSPICPSPAGPASSIHNGTNYIILRIAVRPLCALRTAAYTTTSIYTYIYIYMYKSTVCIYK